MGGLRREEKRNGNTKRERGRKRESGATRKGTNGSERRVTSWNTETARRRALDALL